MAFALQTRLIQYLSSVGTRKREPIALHMIGLTGIGKTSIVETIKKAGFLIHRIDAEKYPGGPNSSADFFFTYALEEALKLKRSADQPLIIFIDEMDKVPEIRGNEEIVQPVINITNEIISEGRITKGRSIQNILNFSNVFILTAMNFRPEEIDRFSAEIFGQPKKYWDFTEEDMEKFDKWIRTSENTSSSVAKILSQFMKSHTVGRLSLDAVMGKPLYGQDFDKIVQNNLKASIARITANPKLRVRVTTTPEYFSFLRTQTSFSPSGARMTVKRVDLLTKQLVTLALRARLDANHSGLDLPREVGLSWSAEKNVAVVTVQAFRKVHSKALSVASRKMEIAYDPAAGSFQIPPEYVQGALSGTLANSVQLESVKARTRRVTAKEITHRRSTFQIDVPLEKVLNFQIFDQNKIARALHVELNKYLGSVETAVRFLTIPGFTGNGKSSIVAAAAAAMEIPVVRINLQQYAAESQAAADQFAMDVYEQLDSARSKSDTGKYILLIEEMDKFFELNPSNGDLTNRPVMGVLKDLMDVGFRNVTIKSKFGDSYKMIDIRDGLTVLTFNFATDRFQVKADPRLTSIDDMRRIYEKITSTPEALREILGTLFLRDTINRLMSRNLIVAEPLTQKGYE